MTTALSELVLRYVRPEPLPVDSIYRAVAQIPPFKSLTRRQRKERRTIADQLQLLTNDGRVHRDVYVNGHITWVGWSLGAGHSERDRTRLPRQDAPVRRVRGVSQP